MNEKNIKKQHSAQALDDDALENVAGGVSRWYGFGSLPQHDSLNMKQKEALKKFGIKIEPVYEVMSGGWQGIGHPPGHYRFTDQYGNEVSDAIIAKLLS